ncbi:MAG: hypothetical protein COA42_14800 [Alteromonadaceae bacterium]|nr:MAG: hypothetical protein COA42_14800 [Alteromonadaceae bacterium]
MPGKEHLFGPELSRSNWDKPSETYKDLITLPLPRGKIVASVYNFRDLTGQYKPQPSSSFSTAVSQGAASMLIKAIKDSGWFSPVEREGLQDLLTERKIIRAALTKRDSKADVPPLLGANILFEGGIIGYESNMKTGGAGAKYFGIGMSEKYRVDQVTVNLRVVDVNSGSILNTVTTSRSILSRSVQGGAFRFVRFKRLLELEGGYTRNEPVQLCLLEAMQAAVMRVIVEGIEDRSWALGNPADAQHTLLAKYGRRAKINDKLAGIHSPKTVLPKNVQSKTKRSKRKAINKNSAQNTKKTAQQNQQASRNTTANTSRKEKAQSNTLSNTQLRKATANPRRPQIAAPVLPAQAPNKQVAKASGKNQNAQQLHSRQITPARGTTPRSNSQPTKPKTKLLAKAKTKTQQSKNSKVNNDINVVEDAEYGIQLMSSTSSMEVIEFASKNKLSRSMIEYIHYQVQGKDRFAIIYGRFHNRERAIKAIESLPPRLRIHEPWVRSHRHT